MNSDVQGGGCREQQGDRTEYLKMRIAQISVRECRFLEMDVQSILNCCARLMVLRLPDGRSADYFSWRFGDTEYWDNRARSPEVEPEYRAWAPGS